MADDTRQSKEREISIRDFNANPENKAFAGEQWKEAKDKYYKPSQNANVLAGGTENTAGGKLPEVTIGNAFPEGFKVSDFAELPKRPCVKDSSKNAIIAAFAVGGARSIFGSPVWKAANWAVGTFCITAFGLYTYCDYKRRASRDGMMRAVEIMNKNAIEKEAQRVRKQKEREQQRQEKDRELDVRYAAARESAGSGGKSWWKFW